MSNKQAFAFIAVTHAVIMGVCLVALWDMRRLKTAQGNRVHAAGANSSSSHPSSSPVWSWAGRNDKELARSTRMRALQLVMKNTAVLLTSFWIAYCKLLLPQRAWGTAGPLLAGWGLYHMYGSLASPLR